MKDEVQPKCKFMAANVCGRERRTRGIIGVLLIVAAFIIGQTIGWVVGIAGLILLLTAMFSYCPINALAHRNSCRPRTFLRDPTRNSMRDSINY